MTMCCVAPCAIVGLIIAGMSISKGPTIDKDRISTVWVTHPDWSLTTKFSLDQNYLCDIFGLTVKPYWMIFTMVRS